MRKKLMEMLESRKDEMIEIRRHLHENPEISFQVSPLMVVPT